MSLMRYWVCANSGVFFFTLTIKSTWWSASAVYLNFKIIKIVESLFFKPCIDAQAFFFNGGQIVALIFLAKSCLQFRELHLKVESEM
jgi:hypothetical protein